MQNQEDELVTFKQKNAELEVELLKLNQILKEKKAQQRETRLKRNETEIMFQAIIHSKWWKLILLLNRLKNQSKEVTASLIGKRNRQELYSKKYRRKKIDNQLKQYRYYLYNLGFTEPVIEELEQRYRLTINRYERKAIAWELTLWLANCQTEISAKQALTYISDAKLKETNEEYLRKVAIIESELQLRIGNKEKAKAIIYTALDKWEHPDLFLAAVNVADTVEQRISCLNQVFAFYNLTPIAISKDTTYYDGIRSKENLEPVQCTQKVTIIVPALNAEHTISTTLDSILSQTWKNIEVIVVDDCSTDQTKKIVQAYAENDKRVQLFTTSINSGPYLARNIGLQAATGDYVTVNDANDWSHPKKIEIQVKHLLETGIISNVSQQVRLTEQVTTCRRGLPGYYIFNNMSSLMFKRNIVTEKIGYWDTVRFAGDSEFVHRLKKVFGDHEVVALKTGPLSFQRQASGPLTSDAAFDYNGHLIGARKEYAYAYKHYHQKVGKLFFPPTQETRLFAVPERMKVNENSQTMFDIIIAGDFRHKTETLKQLLQELQVIYAANYRMAFMQMDTYGLKIPKDINSNIRAFINKNRIPLLTLGDNVRCQLLLIRNAEVLKEKQSYLPDVTPNMVAVVLDQFFVAKLIEEKKKFSVMRKCSQHVREYFDKKGKWLPYSVKERNALNDMNLKYVKLASDNWENGSSYNTCYLLHLKDWVVNNHVISDVSNKGDGYSATKGS